MNLSGEIRKLVSLLIVIISVWATVDAQTLMTGEEREDVLKEVVKDNSNWGKMELKGKLSTPSLPVKGNVKIFMEKGKLLQISVSAIFVGEAFRIECDRDSVTLVNKLRKTWTRFSTKHLYEVYPGIISDLQSLFLGRIVIMGKGELGKKNFRDVELYQTDGTGGYLLTPDSSLQPTSFSYGYSLTPWKELGTLAVRMDNTDNMFAAEFDRNGKELDIDMALVFDNKTREATLMFDAPKSGGKKMKPFEPGKNYRKVRIGEVLKF